MLLPFNPHIFPLPLMNTYILVKLCKCEICGHPFWGCPIPSAAVNNPLKRSALTFFLQVPWLLQGAETSIWNVSLLISTNCFFRFLNVSQDFKNLWMQTWNSHYQVKIQQRDKTFQWWTLWVLAWWRHPIRECGWGINFQSADQI